MPNHVTCVRRVKTHRLPTFVAASVMTVATIGMINATRSAELQELINPAPKTLVFQEGILTKIRFREFGTTIRTTKNKEKQAKKEVVEEKSNPEEEYVVTGYTKPLAAKSAPQLEAKIPEMAMIKHFPESTYIAGAIVVHYEAGAIPSLTEQSGCLWIACNRVLDERFPDELEAVFAQSGAFDGYIPGGEYTEEEYNLAVDVFERFWREQNGFEDVGRTIPKDYLYFYGDGKHNHFTKTCGGTEYVWGSMLVSPYPN